MWHGILCKGSEIWCSGIGEKKYIEMVWSYEENVECSVYEERLCE